MVGHPLHVTLLLVSLLARPLSVRPNHSSGNQAWKKVFDRVFSVTKSALSVRETHQALQKLKVALDDNLIHPGPYFSVVKELVEVMRVAPDKCRLDTSVLRDIDKLKARLFMYHSIVPFLDFQKRIFYEICSTLFGQTILTVSDQFLDQLLMKKFEKLLDSIVPISSKFSAIITRVRKLTAKTLSGPVIVFLEGDNSDLISMSNKDDYERAFNASLTVPCQRISRYVGKFARFYEQAAKSDEKLLDLENPSAFWVASAIVCDRILNNLRGLVDKTHEVLFDGQEPSKLITWLIRFF